MPVGTAPPVRPVVAPDARRPLREDPGSTRALKLLRRTVCGDPEERPMNLDGFDVPTLIMFCAAVAVVVGGLLSSRRRR